MTEVTTVYESNFFECLIVEDISADFFGVLFIGCCPYSDGKVFEEEFQEQIESGSFFDPIMIIVNNEEKVGRLVHFLRVKRTYFGMNESLVEIEH